MHDELHTRHVPQPPEKPSGSWQAPDFTVVDTALEVTAYSLREK
ncbi:pyrroloquinoline quinone precursor peptide PqqA [Streptomyces sp. NPDC006465]